MSSYFFLKSFVTTGRNLLACFTVVLLLIHATNLHAQEEAKNKKPKIKSQRSLETNEDQSLIIYLTDLTVEDDDDGWRYPWGFTLHVFGGNNYTVDGSKITPATNFSGTLTVPVTVDDGRSESAPFDLSVSVKPVNDAPVITAQTPLSVTNTTALSLLVTHLTVTDPDDSYPDDFQLIAYDGEHYSVSGNRVTPEVGYIGKISVPVRVTDGQAQSNQFPVVMDVLDGTSAPEITGQSPVTIEINETFTLEFNHLQVTDPDSQYPNGFTLTIQPGENYTLSDKFITPNENYTGDLIANVSVNDGLHDSNVFPFVITVAPNDGSVPPEAPITGDLQIPTGFTPNGDNVNDTWGITLVSNAQLYADAILRIYSKNGLLVFESAGLQSEWDGIYSGNVLPPDVYFYTVDFNSADAKDGLKGIVTLLR